MSGLSAEKMVQYFWPSLATENAIIFSKHMKAESLTRFEEDMEEFRDKFNDNWIKK
ncbi:hypothetical protein UT300019_03340 [Clostridium sp. CTA-19]